MSRKKRQRHQQSTSAVVFFVIGLVVPSGAITLSLRPFLALSVVLRCPLASFPLS